VPNAPIPIGTEVTASLDLSVDASGPAQLMIAHPSGHDAASIAPGGSGSVRLTPRSAGVLRIFVDMQRADDRGMLTITPSGPSAAVVGDRSEGYRVR
jgi:hypothetical protein